MSNCVKTINFPIKLLKTEFVANDNWRQVPGFDLLHHVIMSNMEHDFITFITCHCVKTFSAI